MHIDPKEVAKDHSTKSIRFLQDEDTESRDHQDINMQSSVLSVIVNKTREENGKSSSPIRVFSSSPNPIFSTNPSSLLHERKTEQNPHIKMAARRRARDTRFHCLLTNFDDSFYETPSPKVATVANA